MKFMNMDFSMISQPALHTARLLLRPFVLSDAADVQRLAGAKEVAATTSVIPHPYPDGAAEAWIQSHRADLQKGTSLVYAICLQPQGELCGAIGLTINPECHHAEMGYWIGVPYWGHGYCTEAAREVVGFAFAQLDLHRIYAHHFNNNPASGRVMQKLGMKHEGCYRQHILKGGKFLDLQIYGLIRSEWLVRKDHIENAQHQAK